MSTTGAIYKTVDELPKRIQAILRDIAAKNGVTQEAVFGPRRSKTLSAARFELYYEVYSTPTLGGRSLSLGEVGAILGGRDHTSIRHGILRHLGMDPKGSGVPSIKRAQPMANVVPVSPEVQAMVLTQFFAQQAA